MKRRSIILIAVCILFCIPLTAWGVNETPTNHDALVCFTTRWIERDAAIPKLVLLNQGYIVTEMKDDYLDLNPGCRIDDFKLNLQAGVGVLLLITHGDGIGPMIEMYQKNASGTQAAMDAIDAYVQERVVDRGYLVYQEVSFGCGIRVDSQLLNAWGNSDNTLIINRACYGSYYSSDWKARCVLDYNYSVNMVQSMTEIDSLFKRFDGSCGLPKRSVKNARTSVTTMSQYGYDETVLAPAFVSFKDESGNPITSSTRISGIVPVTVRFDSKMDQTVDWWDVVESKYTNAQACQGKWTDPDEFTFKIATVTSGPAELTINASNVKAEGDGLLYLDGNGIGPAKDNARLPFYSEGGDNDCQAASVEVMYVTDSLGVRTFNWVVGAEPNVGFYDVLGEPGDVKLATVFPEGGPYPRLYSVEVPSGYASYALQQTESGPAGGVLKERPIMPGAPLLSAFQIRQLKNTYATADRTVVAPPFNPLSTGIEDGRGEGDGGGGSPAVDYILVGPDSLLNACRPLEAWWAAHGFSSRRFTTDSPDPTPVVSALHTLADQAARTGQGLPSVFLIGEASEDSSRNILSTFCEPDTIGCAFFGTTIPTDDPYGDFDGDGVSDFDLFRIPAHRAEDVSHSVETFLMTLEPARSAKRLVAMHVGDIPFGGLDPAKPIEAAAAAQALYQDMGFAVARLNDSDYAFSDLTTRQEDAIRLQNSGVSELVMLGPSANRSRGAADIYQVVTAPVLDVARIANAPPFIIVAPICDWNDIYRSNPVYYPTLVMRLMFGARLAGSISCSTGGHGTGHYLMNQELMSVRFSGVRDAGEYFWRAKRNFAKHYPALVQYARETCYLGWPAPLPERQLTASGVPDASPVPGLTLTASPNPTTGRSNIGFALSQTGNVRLEVFDLAGRLVRTVFDGARPSGLNQVSWDGRSDSGQAVASGMYFARCRAGGGTQHARIVVAR